jgi:photosystem II stability/assembly factor-like uncharacterized protein
MLKKYTYILSLGFLSSLMVQLSSCKKVEPVIEPADAPLYINLLHSGTLENLKSVKFFDTEHGVCLGALGGFYKTENGGLSWEKSYAVYQDTNKSVVDTTIVCNKLFFLNENIGWVVGSLNTRNATGTQTTAKRSILRRTLDGGATWEDKKFDTLPKVFTEIKFYNDKIGYLLSSAGLIYFTTDGGDSWTPQTSGVTSNLRCIDITSVRDAMIVGPNGVVLKTTNQGATWTKLASPASRGFHKITHAANDESVFYAVGGGEGNQPNPDKAFVYKIDANGNFEDLTNKYYSVFWLSAMHVSEDGNTIWTAGHLGQIFKSSDAGKSWSDELSKSKRAEVIEDMAFPTDRVGYFVGEEGVILKVDLDRE